MVIFEFEEDATSQGEVVYQLATTECTGADKEHSNEIYQQLDADTAGLTQ